MPTFVTGNLWDEIGKADLILVTTNSTLTKNGALVMGRGAALEAKKRYPQLPYLLGHGIASLLFEKATNLYGIALWPEIHDQGTAIGAFQVKYDWRDVARVEIIAYSAGYLRGIAWDCSRIALNYPGIGNGRLDRSLIEPFLAPLPAHVYIYTKEAKGQ